MRQQFSLKFILLTQAILAVVFLAIVATGTKTKIHFWNSRITVDLETANRIRLALQKKGFAQSVDPESGGQEKFFRRDTFGGTVVVVLRTENSSLYIRGCWEGVLPFFSKSSIEQEKAINLREHFATVFSDLVHPKNDTTSVNDHPPER